MMKHIINIEDTTHSGDNKQNVSESYNEGNDSVYYCNTKTHKNKKRKKQKKKEPSLKSSTSDSENSFSSEDSVEESASTKSQGFQIITKSESDIWELSGAMIDYVNQQFKCIIPEKDAYENLIILETVPENVRSFKKLFDFLNSMEKTRTYLWKNCVDVVGPLSRLWKGLDDIKNATEDTVLVPVEGHIKLTEQVVFLLGQGSN